MEQLLLQLYKENGVFGERSDMINLHEACQDKDECWKNILDKGCNYNKIQKPYIGENYDNQVLFVGLNLNRHGGWDSINKLFDGDQSSIINSLSIGQKRMRFGNTKKEYAGTLIYHRIAVYASILIGSELNLVGQTIITPNQINIYNDNKILSETMKKIAFTEAVKCSPNTGKSVPTKKMKINCPTRYLLKEISIIKPKKIVLHDKQIFEQVKKKYILKDFAVKTKQSLSWCKIELDGIIYELFYIIHPAAPSGCAVKYGLELFQLQKEIFKAD